MRRRFGTKVYRLSLQSGCTCPNRDGSIGTGGCTFCSEGGSGDFAAPLLPISEQIEEARERVDPKIPASIAAQDRRYIAYFQSYTNTYGNVDRLRALYLEALSHPQIVTLDIGTRPDCLPDETVQMLRDLQISSGKPVWVELGLQTIHEKTARRVHRGYELPVFEDAYRRLKEPFGAQDAAAETASGEAARTGATHGHTAPLTDRCASAAYPAGLEVIVHVILGLPGETREDMLETVRYLSHLKPPLDGIKLQLLHILKGTQLAGEYEAEPFPLPTLDSYSDLIVDCLKLLPPETVVHRITGDGPKKLLVAPLWSADKKHVLNTLNKKIREA
ncbi:MAG: TIGR01212 family radical SAM protein [Lachnospiraceae bacterium]|nr:TIGR01212 family radical SAM protein [Lachnospiraceae bacterium]